MMLRLLRVFEEKMRGREDASPQLAFEHFIQLAASALLQDPPLPCHAVLPPLACCWQWRPPLLQGQGLSRDNLKFGS